MENLRVKIKFIFVTFDCDIRCYRLDGVILPIIYQDFTKRQKSLNLVPVNISFSGYSVK